MVENMNVDTVFLNETDLSLTASTAVFEIGCSSRSLKYLNTQIIM